MADVNSIRTQLNAAGYPLYYGTAVPGTLTSAAGWQIMACTYDTNNSILTSLWADGNTAFDNIWDNRVSLSYS